MSSWLDILNGSAALLQAVPGAPLVQVRKEPELRDEDVLPILIVSPAGPEEIAWEAWVLNTAWRYPVYVFYVTVDDRTQAVDLTTQQELRQTMRDALYGLTLAGAAQVYNTDIQSLTPFVVTPRDMTLNVTGFMVEYYTVEQRAA